MTVAALGGVVDAPCLVSEACDGRCQASVDVPAGAQTGKTVRIKSKGMPHLNGRGRGDLVVELFVETPTDLTPRQKELLEELAQSFGEAQNPRNSSFAGKAKRFWADILDRSLSAIFHAGISGYRGRMGRAVSQVLDAREDVVVAARFDWGETADISLCDVIIDFSTPDASVALAQAAASRGGPTLVIGSTGFTPEQEAELLKASETVAIVKSGNFSLGVNILIGLVQHAAQRLDAQDWDIEITEAHHRRKVDAPSGTALMLGEAAAEG
ncbi:hypothetical protein LTR94_028483, partial [Friedmanniomyces endolithicus]